MLHLPHLDWHFGDLPWLARKSGVHAPDFPSQLVLPMAGGAASPVKSAYGTSNQAITCTITSLASSATAGRASTAVDNSANVFLDVLVFGKVKTSASALANDKACYLSAYGTADGGTTYTDGITGTDANFTRTDPSNLHGYRAVNCPAVSTTYNFGPFSWVLMFGGSLPDHWGVWFTNFTGQTTDATIGSLWYQGVYANVG